MREVELITGAAALFGLLNDELATRGEGISFFVLLNVILPLPSSFVFHSVPRN